MLARERWQTSENTIFNEHPVLTTTTTADDNKNYRKDDNDNNNNNNNNNNKNYNSYVIYINIYIYVLPNKADFWEKEYCSREKDAEGCSAQETTNQQHLNKSKTN